MRNRFIFNDLKEETCFECCNEQFAKDLIYANKSSGNIKFKAKYVMTKKTGERDFESFTAGTRYNVSNKANPVFSQWENDEQAIRIKRL